jgi:hypothetical protein
MNTTLFRLNLDQLNPTLDALKEVYQASLYPSSPLPTATNGSHNGNGHHNGNGNGAQPAAQAEKPAGWARSAPVQGL